MVRLPVKSRAYGWVAFSFLVAWSAWAQSQPLELTRQLHSRGGVQSPAAGKPFAPWMASSMVTRSYSLADLGLTQPVSLDGSNASQTFYFPALAGLDLHGVRWQLDHRHVGEVSGDKVAVHLAGEAAHWGSVAPGEAPQAVGGELPHLKSDSAFVPLRVSYAAPPVSPAEPAAPNGCPSQPVMDTRLLLLPSTRLSYGFGSSQIQTMADAWAVLPANPVILLPDLSLSAEAYESAWKLGAALAHVGRHPVFDTLPHVGKSVVLDGLTPPNELLVLPAFAALADKRSAVLQNPAEVMAWFLMRIRQGQGMQFVLADAGMRRALEKGSEQMLAQISEHLPSAESQWKEWMALWSLTPDGTTAAPVSRVLSTPAGPTLWLQPGAMPELSALAGVRQTPAVGSGIFSKQSVVPLTDMGAELGTFAVRQQLEWRTSFRAADTALAGKVPAEVVLDVQMPALTDGADPVLSVYLNDALLTALRLSAGVKPERIKAGIPSYLLKVRNELKVLVQRQATGVDCRQTLAPHPFSILPSSHWVVGPSAGSGSFAELAVGLSREGELRVEKTEFLRADQSLPRLVWLTHALGVVPLNMRVVVSGTTAPSQAKVPYLAVANPSGRSETASGLARLALETQGGYPHAQLTWLGQMPEGEWPKTPDLTGQSVLLGLDGRVKEVNGAQVSGEAYSAEVREPWLKRQIGWLVPLAMVSAFVALLVFASRRRRRLES